MKIEKPTPTCPEDEAYIAYIDKHRNNVYTAFLRFGKALCLSLSLVNGEYDTLRFQIFKHDISKFGAEEFYGYRQNFFPKKEEEPDHKKFQKAWKHHYMNNPHHWNYYVEDGTAKAMNKLDIAEMLLDWIAMSMEFKNSPITWYNQNKQNINLEKNTRNLVEASLAILSTSRLYPFYIKSKHKKPVSKKRKNDNAH